MIKLNYLNYLKVEGFDYKEKYFNDLNKIRFITPSESIDQRYKRYLKSGTFREIFMNYKLKDIILANELELNSIIADIDSKFSRLTKRKKTNLISKIESLFKYSNKFQSSVLTPFFTENFNFRTCFYCNKDFITNFRKTRTKLVSTFQLDHFFDKDTYPYLALSFYNLIPSCPTCNSSKVKGSKNTYTEDSNMGTFENESCIIPNSNNFNFENRVKFKIFLDVSCKNLQIKDKEDIDIQLKERFSNDYEKYIEIFKLNERYKTHKDIVLEMITKAEHYPESRLKELQNLTGIPFQQIKKDIFNLIDENEDLSQKPFSKLIKDISEELKI